MLEPRIPTSASTAGSCEASRDSPSAGCPGNLVAGNLAPLLCHRLGMLRQERDRPAPGRGGSGISVPGGSRSGVPRPSVGVVRGITPSGSETGDMVQAVLGLEVEPSTGRRTRSLGYSSEPKAGGPSRHHDDLRGRSMVRARPTRWMTARGDELTEDVRVRGSNPDSNQVRTHGVHLRLGDDVGSTLSRRAIGRIVQPAPRPEARSLHAERGDKDPQRHAQAAHRWLHTLEHAPLGGQAGSVAHDGGASVAQAPAAAAPVGALHALQRSALRVEGGRHHRAVLEPRLRTRSCSARTRRQRFKRSTETIRCSAVAGAGRNGMGSSTTGTARWRRTRRSIRGPARWLGKTEARHTSDQFVAFSATLWRIHRLARRSVEHRPSNSNHVHAIDIDTIVTPVLAIEHYQPTKVRITEEA